MPIYEYVCNQCHHPFEALVRGDEKPECPHCGGSDLNKQFSVLSAHSLGDSGTVCDRIDQPVPS